MHRSEKEHEVSSCESPGRQAGLESFTLGLGSRREKDRAGWGAGAHGELDPLQTRSAGSNVSIKIKSLKADC